MKAEDVGSIVNRLASEDLQSPGDEDRREGMTARARLLASLVKALSVSARTAGIRAVAGGRWLADEMVELAPRLAFRDGDTLRRHYPNLTDTEIAEKLIASAKRRTAALGAAAGGLAAAEFVALPTLFAAPVQIAAETLAVTAVEFRMVAELHEVLGVPARGTPAQKAGAYLTSWIRRRAVGDAAETAGVSGILGTAARRELRSQMLRKLGRSTTSLAPFLAGAVAGAEVNRRATGALGERIMNEITTPERDRWFRQV